MNAIEISGLSKCFGRKQAVRGLDLEVPEGAIYGFIGENGSGKSTTEKMVCGLLNPDAGSIKLYGHAADDERIRANMGVLIESPGCYPNLSVWNNMMLHAMNLGIKNPEAEIARVLKLVRMEGAASNKFRNCSLGMRQRVGIALALMGRPKLLILDEPINGLDADGMRIMREILTDATENQGATVLISSHVLGELEKIATHYGIIRKGRMMRQMTAAELEADCPVYVRLTCANARDAARVLGAMYRRVELAEDGAVRVMDAQAPDEVTVYLFGQGIVVDEIGLAKITLEEYYVTLMQGQEGSAR